MTVDPADFDEVRRAYRGASLPALAALKGDARSGRGLWAAPLGAADALEAVS